MHNVFARSEEKYLMTTVLYADKDDGNLFSDSAKSQGVDKDTVKDLFMKNLLTIDLDGELFKPTTLKDNTTYVTVTAVKDSGSAATMLNFNSSEYSAG